MIRRVVVAAAALGFSLLVGVSPALAQPEAGTIFVTGAGLFVVDKVASSAGEGLAPVESGNGTVAGATLGVGIHLTPQVAFRAEWSATGDITRRSDFNGVLAQSALFDLSQSLATMPGVRLLDQQFSTTRESKAVFALLGYRLPAGRHALELVGGLGLVKSSVVSSYEVRFSVPSGFFAPIDPYVSTFASTSYHAVAVVGADAAVSLTSRLALVPQVRAYALNGGLSLRLGAGLRWTF